MTTTNGTPTAAKTLEDVTLDQLVGLLEAIAIVKHERAAADQDDPEGGLWAAHLHAAARRGHVDRAPRCPAPGGQGLAPGIRETSIQRHRAMIHSV